VGSMRRERRAATGRRMVVESTVVSE
jgi:hypothetical protein